MPARSATLASSRNAVRAIREAHDPSQEELATRCGLHRTYVGDIERGERNPSYESIVKLATGLGVSGSDVLAHAERRSRSR